MPDHLRPTRSVGATPSLALDQRRFRFAGGHLGQTGLLGGHVPDRPSELEPITILDSHLSDWLVARGVRPEIDNAPAGRLAAPLLRLSHYRCHQGGLRSRSSMYGDGYTMRWRLSWIWKTRCAIAMDGSDVFSGYEEADCPAPEKL